MPQASYITAAASTARATEATTARAGAASDWIVGAGVGASVGAEDRVGAIVGMCVQSSSVAMLTSWIWLSFGLSLLSQKP